MGDPQTRSAWRTYRISSAIAGAAIAALLFQTSSWFLLAVVVGAAVGWFAMPILGIPMFFVAGIITPSKADPNERRKQNIEIGSLLMATVGLASLVALFYVVFLQQRSVLGYLALLAVLAEVAILWLFDVAQAKQVNEKLSLKEALDSGTCPKCSTTGLKEKEVATDYVFWVDMSLGYPSEGNAQVYYLKIYECANCGWQHPVSNEKSQVGYDDWNIPDHWVCRKCIVGPPTYVYSTWSKFESPFIQVNPDNANECTRCGEKKVYATQYLGRM